jgi:hypothetical protein
VVARAKQAGMKVDQQLDDVGIIGGTIEADKLADLRAVEGVAEVERSREVRIAPPDSEIQ